MSGAWLRVLVRGREERRFPLVRDRVRVGRADDNDLAIQDLSLSREHAWLVRHEDGWRVTDRGSRNGSVLNNQRLTGEALLRDGDVIRLGETTLVFREADSLGVRLAERGPLLQGSISIPARDLLSSTFRGAAPEDARLIDVFARASRMLIAKAEEAEVHAEALSAAIEAVGADRGALLLLEGDPPELVARATKIRHGDPGLVLSRTITRTVLEQRSSVLTTDAQADPRFDGAQSVSLQGIRAAMCAPLWHEEQVAGVLYVDRRFSARQFSENDLAMLTVLANLTAAKLQNLRLLEEAQVKRKLEEELALAADIQHKLLPREAPRRPGWDFAASSLASRAVGGDLFDFIAKPSGRLGLVVADVSGKGMSAALLMASLQANLRAFALGAPDLAEMMSQVNLALLSMGARNKFATIFFAELDPETGEIAYVNAGHNPGLLLRRDGSLQRLQVGGLIAGSFAQARYAVGQSSLEPGDLLLLFSDGITEAVGPDDELFGDERLEKALRSVPGGTAADVREAILDAVEAFTHGSQLADDTTLLVARRV